MPPIVVPDVGRVAAKWQRRSASAGPEYEEGVRSTTKSWERSTVAAEGNYKAGVTAAANAGRFGKGVARSGDAKWKRGAMTKGPDRFASGVAAAGQDYTSGVAPFIEAIGRVDVPPRGPAGSESNYARVSAIGKALRQLAQSR